MHAVIKAHDETANSKIDVKACLLKYSMESHFIGMHAVIKAHDETANSKIDVKACLLKYMVTKQSLLL